MEPSELGAEIVQGEWEDFVRYVDAKGIPLGEAVIIGLMAVRAEGIAEGVANTLKLVQKKT